MARGGKAAARAAERAREARSGRAERGSESSRRADDAASPTHHSSMSRPQPKFEITPDILLRAYSIGLFPMAESREADDLFWVEPEERGVFPLDG